MIHCPDFCNGICQILVNCFVFCNSRGCKGKLADIGRTLLIDARHSASFLAITGVEKTRTPANTSGTAFSALSMLFSPLSFFIAFVFGHCFTIWYDSFGLFLYSPYLFSMNCHLQAFIFSHSTMENLEIDSNCPQLKRETISVIAAHFCSISATSLNCVLARSRLWASR